MHTEMDQLPRVKLRLLRLIWRDDGRPAQAEFNKQARAEGKNTSLPDLHPEKFRAASSLPLSCAGR